MQSFLETVMQHLPALRRFARGHATDLDAADELLLSALDKVRFKWLLVDPTAVKHEVYRAIHSLVALSESDGNRATHCATSTRNDLGRHLQTMSALDRSMLLLASVEGLDYQDIGWVLRIPDSQVVSRLTAARERLRTIAEAFLRGNPAGPKHLRRVK